MQLKKLPIKTMDITEFINLSTKLADWIVVVTLEMNIYSPLLGKFISTNTMLN
jgi:hypothetical protein